MHSVAFAAEEGVADAKVAENRVLSCFQPNLRVSNDNIKFVISHSPHQPLVFGVFLRVVFMIEQFVRLSVVQRNY